MQPAVVVLPAFTAAEYTGDVSELSLWLDRYQFETTDLAGLPSPLYTTDQIALTPTGIGKSATATTVATLAASEAIDISDATIMTVGIAGVRPAAGTLGSVFLADSVVDSDIKLRIGDTVQPSPWLVTEYCWELNSELVEHIYQATRDVPLADSEAAGEIRAAYDDDRSPTVAVGPTACGDEVYHGTQAATTVEELCEQYGLDEFATTEMEDAATATTLQRFGLLDQYVSIRAAANFDREPPGGDPHKSIEHDVFALAAENAFRVGEAAVEELLD